MSSRGVIGMDMNIFSAVDSMPTDMFKKLRKELAGTPDYYLLSMDPKRYSKKNLESVNEVLGKFDLPCLASRDDFENLACAILARSTLVR